MAAQVEASQIDRPGQKSASHNAAGCLRLLAEAAVDALA
jgi:hypothetical protein